MTPVNQEFHHNPSEGIQGDCQRAVIASLLDLPLSEVPHFLERHTGDTDDYYARIQEFVSSKGYIWVTIRASRLYAFGINGCIYHEIAGPSPRGNGMEHAVVGKNGRIVHDPHPSKAGLAGDPALWTYSLLVRKS